MKIASINGIVITICCALVGAIFPILMGTLGTSKRGWIPMVGIIAVPFMVFGMLRFFLVKEVNTVDSGETPK